MLMWASIIMLSGCAYFSKKIDISSLNSINNSISKDVKPCSQAEVSAIFSQRDGYTNFSKMKDKPLYPEPGVRWKLKPIDGKSIVSLRLSAQSEYFNDKIFYYFFKTKDWDGEKAILWVPGFGVNDFAFRFIRKFFYEELKRGYAVLVYVLPYHLDRLKEGKKEGEGLITGNILTNINTLHALSSELNVGYQFLRSKGVVKIGAWAGSIGASALTILATDREFDHIALMIPILDWNTMIFHPVFNNIRNNLRSSFCNDDTIRDAYSLVSPISYPLNITPDRVLIQYAFFDQLTPAEKVRTYAEKRNIKRVIGYRKSHASILLDSSVYKDYVKFLQYIR